MGRIYNTSGGFRKLHAFNFATIIHLGTISFCKTRKCSRRAWKRAPNQAHQSARNATSR